MNILAFVNGHALAHVTRMIEVCKEGQKRIDCSIWFAGHGKFMSLAKSEGYQTYDVPYVSEEIVKEVLVKKQYKALFPFDKMKESFNADVQLCKELKPDLIISDNHITARTVGDYLNIPVYSIMNTHVSSFMKSPYFDWKLKFPKLPSKLVAFLNHKQLKVESFFMDKFFFYGLKKLRKQLKLKKLKGFEHEQGHTTLIPDLPEFNPSIKLPESAHFIGPLLWKPTMAPPAFIKKLDKSKRTIFISLGSLSHQDILKKVNELEESKHQFILVAGDSNIELPKSLPKNVFIERFVNLDHILPFCDLIICHGGNGTIYQALQHGLPIIGCPKHDEQNYNVQLVIKNGLGLGFNPCQSDKINISDWIHLADKVLGDNQFKQNALKMKSLFNVYDAPKKAFDLIMKNENLHAFT